MTAPKVKSKGKMVVLLAGYILLLFALVIRIGFIQLAQGEELQLKALERQTRDSQITSRRGSVLDRNGEILAQSVTVERVAVTPGEVRANKKTSPEEIARRLAEILELEEEAVLKKINANTGDETIKRRVEKEAADEVRRFMEETGVSGIRIVEDTKRVYPYGKLASHVIGFVGDDNQGLEGVESVYDKYLKGVPGRVITATDSRGIEMPFRYERYIDAQDGMNVELTIDQNIQHFVENHLETAAIENKLTNGAACIIMQPETGDILAMATYPAYDLNNPYVIEDEEIMAEINALPQEEQNDRKWTERYKLWRNKAVVDSYEPGSTFKIMTSAMALEENAVKLSDTFQCNGSTKVGPHTIRCWKAGGHGLQDFTKAVQNSCNPAFIEIGARVGTEKFLSYFHGFGLRETTGIELPGETNGLFQKEFNEVELATSSFGQGFSITPLQMITAVSAVANEGKLMQPKLVKRITDKNGNIVEEKPDTFVRQIVSPETAKTLCSVLESVVSDGSGGGAYIRGYRIGGKTGTSEKVPRGNGMYVASFVGMAPADDPQLVCLLLLDEPHGVSHFGGVIATPVVRKIMEDCLHYMQIEPAYTSEELATLEAELPDVRGMSTADARNRLETNEFRVRVEGEGDTVKSMMPKSGSKVNRQSLVVLYTEEEPTIGNVIVPNVVGQTVQGATSLLTKAGLNIKVVGAGADGTGYIVSGQEPAAQSEAVPGTVVTVEFSQAEPGE